MMLNMLFNTFLKIKPGNRKEEEAEKTTHPAFYPARQGLTEWC